jgi:hypothetical protein
VITGKTADVAKVVERIVDKRKRGKGFQYLVKWSGQADEENSWEPRVKLVKSAVFLSYLASEASEAEALE